MKILVTGANGYLGQGIVKNLLDKGNNVVATDFDIMNIDERAERIAANIFEIAAPYEFFGKPDVCLHLAWRDGFVHSSDAHILDLPKHHMFIENMLKSGLKRLAVMGSMHEVGFFEGSIDESVPCNPLSLYGIGKNSLRQITELLVKKYDVKLQWLRGYYIVGNIECGSSIFCKIATAAKSGKREFPFTSGTNEYDFLDYNDFCEQVSSAVMQEEINGIINICSGVPESLGSRVERFIKDNNYDIVLQYGVFPDRPYDSKSVWGNNAKIKKIMKA